MKQIKGAVSIGLQGCTVEFEFEMDDDSTHDEIAEGAREAMFQQVEWWYTIDGRDPDEYPEHGGGEVVP